MAVGHTLQGMTKAAGSIEDTPSCIKLWAHEVLRVFYDRLVDDADKLLVGRLMEELMEKHFKEKLGRLLGMTITGGATAASDDDLLAGLRSLVFGDFMAPGSGVSYCFSRECSPVSFLQSITASCCIMLPVSYFEVLVDSSR